MRWTLSFMALLCGVLGCPPAETPGGDMGPGAGGDPNAASTALSPQEPAPPAMSGATALLNEVLFDPADGDSQFVELRIGADGDAAATLKLLNDAGDEFALPSDAPQPAEGQSLLIVFDGRGEVADGVVHATLSTFLGAASGWVALLDENGAELDRVAWGADQPDSVPLGGGGVIGLLSPGTSVARRPQSTTAGEVRDWTVVGPAFATPGAANYNPGVGQLHPMDGAVLDAGDIDLSWFPVIGAARYRLQVATDAAFSDLIFDETIDNPERVVTLSPGMYYWRVQAIAADDTVSDYSPVNALELVDDLEGFITQALEAGGTGKARNSSQRLSMRVPVYAQRKDTVMLLLESDDPSGTRQAWNAPHPETDVLDPADNTNCALGSTSMVNGYLTGASDDQPKLSQDRIGLEVFTNFTVLQPGPERDLMYGRGLTDSEYRFALEFALGAAVELRVISDEAIIREVYQGVYDATFREEFWTAVGESIARDRPMPFAAWTGANGAYKHAMVARGRVVAAGKRYVWVNDPWKGRAYLWPLDTLKVCLYFILPDAVDPFADEADLRNETDSDDDKVIDFDEERRFTTDKMRRDTDRDCIDDFEEIELSVFDPDHGWGQHWGKKTKGFPFVPSDGKARMGNAPEISIDTDGGGLPDFVEDINRNGKIERELGESDPFDPDDDARTITGSIMRTRDQPGETSDIDQQYEYEINAQTSKGGKAEGTAQMTYNWMNTLRADAAPPSCPEPRVIVDLGDEVKQTLQIEIEFVCSSDPDRGPGLIVREKDPVFQFVSTGTFKDPCLGDRPTTATMPSSSGLNGLGVDGASDRFFPTMNRVQWKYTAKERQGLSIFADWDLIMRPK